MVYDAKFIYSIKWMCNPYKTARIGGNRKFKSCSAHISWAGRSTEDRYLGIAVNHAPKVEVTGSNPVQSTIYPIKNLFFPSSLKMIVLNTCYE